MKTITIRDVRVTIIEGPRDKWALVINGRLRKAPRKRKKKVK